MDKDLAISLNKVSKKFRMFSKPIERLFEALHPFGRKFHKPFWALDNISLSIQRGHTVGIVGRNGSGKSTLLQIIAGVMRPSAGTVDVNGRISALLELGSGFNPEFTGRDNIFINGAIMGMNRDEMEDRYPDIVAFADIGEFIDQPVKTYSSGMMVRLAFACAINVKPEILIVDEALAVGDAKFQHKCFQRIHEFQDNGCTILLVSHDVGAIIKHCDIAVFIEAGQILEVGDTEEVCNFYLEMLFTGKIQDYVKEPHLVDETDMHWLYHYRKSFFGIEKDKKPDDFFRVDHASRKSLAEKWGIVEASSLPLLRESLLGNTPATDLPTTNTDSSNNSAVTSFLRSTNHADLCAEKATYNRSETRVGTREAEIIDYLFVVDGDSDRVEIHSGAEVQLYIKTLFHTHVSNPHFGFALKTCDNSTLYGTNTAFARTHIEAASPGSIYIYTYAFKLPLASGHYFFDLGVAFGIEGDSLTPLDRRCSIFSVQVYSPRNMGGVVDLNPTHHISSTLYVPDENHGIRSSSLLES